MIDRLDAKIAEFDDALGEEPRTIDRARAEHLEMLARYAQQLAQRIVEVLQSRTWIDPADSSRAALCGRLEALASATHAKAHERARRTWAQRYSWAAADGRQLRWHHLAGMRRLLHALNESVGRSTRPSEGLGPWNRTEEDESSVAAELAKWVARLDEIFPRGFWRKLERQPSLSSQQDAVLRDLIAAIPRIDAGNLGATLHWPLRKALLAELGRRDPSLAFRVASHLWARDLASLASASTAYTAATSRLNDSSSWACLAVVEEIHAAPEGLTGEAWFVPAQAADNVVLLVGDQLAIIPQSAPALRIELIETLGLRGAGLGRIRIEGSDLGGAVATVDRDRMRRVYQILSCCGPHVDSGRHGRSVMPSRRGSRHQPRAVSGAVPRRRSARCDRQIRCGQEDDRRNGRTTIPH